MPVISSPPVGRDICIFTYLNNINSHPELDSGSALSLPPKIITDIAGPPARRWICIFKTENILKMASPFKIGRSLLKIRTRQSNPHFPLFPILGPVHLLPKNAGNPGNLWSFWPKKL